MHFSTPFPQNFTWLILILTLSLLFSLSFSDPRTSEAGLFCATSMASNTSNFRRQFFKLMDSLSNDITSQHYGFRSIISPSSNIFGLAQCHLDLSSNDCDRCFTKARSKLLACIPTNSGRIYLDGCYLRYDNYSFSVESCVPNFEYVNCGTATGVLSDKYMTAEFANKVNTAVKNVTVNAAVNGGFAVAELKGGAVGVYALAQCWFTVDRTNCIQCLENAGKKVIICAPAGDARAMNAGCYLRYSTTKFYDSTAESKVIAGSSKTLAILGVGLVAIAIGLLSFLAAFIGYGSLLVSQEQNNLSQIPASINKSNLNFKYEILEKATKFFDPSRKLGQGGAGSVFKGTLPDGRTVAVKRLFFNTRQWVDEFFNEVNLISGIQHKNLIKLLGCSIEGPESLLVYEYVPNKSLDQCLFGNKAQILSWKERIEIIVGTADGLAYLHGGSGSQVKIVHRDIKCSNILLDENLTPKIADFGLVRSVAGDKTHISTGIAGTLGYMAPEYLVRGQLTEKADVYAFGVLVLEIVCGRKNNVFTQGSKSILQTVWKHYKSKKIVRSVDPSLKGDFSVEEASSVLQLGLLCTQASTALRPSMSEVVKMLNDKESAIPSPKQPPFLNSSFLGSDDSTKSSTVNSLASNGYRTAETSSTFNESSSNVHPESNGPSIVQESNAPSIVQEPNAPSIVQTSEPR